MPIKGHVATLDGVRGLAVLLVMACHFSEPMPLTTSLGAFVSHVFYEGWVGVDLFFVLSGYLITSGLVAPSTLRVSARMRRFYMRRVLRIFPLYYATLGVGSLLRIALGRPPPGLAFWLYLDNIPPFDHAAGAWTGHLWSLAVEEQFYLLWPAVMLLLANVRARTTILLLSAGIALRFGLLFGSSMSFKAITGVVYHAMFTNADCLLLGSLLAITETDERATRAWSKLQAPMLAIVLTLFLVPRFLSTTGSDTFARIAWGFEPLALACGFTMLVSVAAARASAPHISAFLSRDWLTSCGRVSYGMYLLHWPIAAFVIPYVRRANAVLSPWSATALNLFLMAIGTVLVRVLADLSYRWFESPFLALKSRFAG